MQSSPAQIRPDAAHTLSISQLARMLRNRELSARELVSQYLGRIAELNPQINAFIELRSEEALRDAELADEKLQRGDGVGPLHGIPVSIKSSIAVSGLKWEAGSPTRRGLVAEQDAVLVRRLRDAGAVILGNTNVPEMLMAYESENPLYGRTNHPSDPARTPGGSSGGEAAAIAAYLCAAGVGSDGGGSIRVPAHFSGICGLKPTPGRIPATGHWPESLGPFALLGVVGPMARSAADLEILFRVMAGYDAGDVSAPPLPLREIKERDLVKVTIGYFVEHPDAPVTAETKTAVRTAIEHLSRAGFRTQEFLPDVLHEAREHWWTLFVRLAAEMLAPEFKGREQETSTILTYADRAPSKEDLLAAWFQRDALRLRLARQMEDFPVLVCPACSVPAFRHGEREWTIEGKRVNYMDAMSYTQWFNLLGNPAVVLPIGNSAEGLPIGVQIVGRPNEEELVLAVARRLEKQITSRK